jgi:hypothetical protein
MLQQQHLGIACHPVSENRHSFSGSIRQRDVLCCILINSMNLIMYDTPWQFSSYLCLTVSLKRAPERLMHSIARLVWVKHLVVFLLVLLSSFIFPWFNPLVKKSPCVLSENSFCCRLNVNLRCTDGLSVFFSDRARVIFSWQCDHRKTLSVDTFYVHVLAFNRDKHFSSKYTWPSGPIFSRSRSCLGTATPLVWLKGFPSNLLGVENIIRHIKLRK